MDSCRVFVILPLVLEESDLLLCHVQLSDRFGVLFSFLESPVARWMGVGHVDSHLLETVVFGVRDVGTVGDDAVKGCVSWGLLLHKRWSYVSSISSRPFNGWSFGG